jgi:hypothetical protein
MSKFIDLMSVSGAVLTAMASHLLFPSAYVHVPFQAGLKGANANIEFYAPLSKYYQFYLDLRFRERDEVDRQRVRKLAGGGANTVTIDPVSKIRTFHPVDTGLPIPVHLVISRLDGDRVSVVLDLTSADHRLEGWGGSEYSKIIAGTTLEPGRYRAHIEALDNVPALQDVPVDFDVHVPGNLQ